MENIILSGEFLELGLHLTLETLELKEFMIYLGAYQTFGMTLVFYLSMLKHANYQKYKNDQKSNISFLKYPFSFFSSLIFNSC